MACAPAVAKVWLSVAVAPLRVTGTPMLSAPSLNWTVPPAGAGLTVAVRSTAAPVFAVVGAATAVVVVASGGAVTLIVASGPAPALSGTPLPGSVPFFG